MTVSAPAYAIFAGLHSVTVAEMPVARFLGWLRYLPGRLMDHPPIQVDQSPFIESLKRGGTVKLREEPGREVVYGGAGKYHQILDQEPYPFTDAAQFDAFADPAYQKLAIAIRVEATAVAGQNRLVMEHRTHALSDKAARQFPLLATDQAAR